MLLNILVSVGLSLMTHAQESTRTAELFDFSGNKQFTYSAKKVDKPEGWEISTEYKNLKGDVVVKETSRGKGPIFISYSIERPQTKEKGTIEAKDDKVTFKYWDRFNEKDERREKIEPNYPFIVGHMIPDLIEKNWDKILKKEEVDTKYAVWYRKESLAFRFKLKEETNKEGKNWVNVTMEPSSFVIRQLVDPLVFSFDKATKKLMQIRGRTIPKIEVDGKFKDFDAETRYAH